MILVSVNLSLLASYAPTTTGQLPPARESWLAALLAGAVGLGLTFVAYALCNRFEGQTVYEFTRKIWGRFFGTVFTIAMIGYFLFWATATTRQFAMLMSSVVFLRTPEIVFVIAFLILGFVGAGQGIEFIGRAAELSGLLVMVGIALIAVGSFAEFDPGMLRPLFGEGVKPVLLQSLTSIGVFGESVWVVLLAVPHLNKMKDGVKAIFLGIGLNALFISLGAAFLIGIFGTELLTVLAFGPLSAARLITFTAAIERVEWLLIMMWLGAMGLKISLLIHGARLGVSSLFPRLPAGWVLLGVGVAVFGWSLFLHGTLPQVLSFFRPQTYLPYALPLQVAPILFIIVALLRGVKTRPS